MVEQGTENPRVGSSILSLGTRESKGLQRKLQAFFRYGLLPDAHLRQPPGGAFHRAGLPALLLPPPPPFFPAVSFVLSLSRSRDCPRRYRWLLDAHTGLHPYGLLPGAAHRVPHIRIIMPAPLCRCRVSSVTAFSQGKKREGNLRSFPLPVVGLWGMARLAAGSQARDMPSPPKTRTFSSSPQRRSRSRTALGP